MIHRLNPVHFIVGLLFLTSILVTGCRQDDSSVANSGRDGIQAGESRIDRETFSLQLPKGWYEDTADDMHDPNGFVFFENPESCFVLVMINDSSSGTTVDDHLRGQRNAYEKLLKNSRTTKLSHWGKIEAKGFEINGKSEGILSTKVKIYGFQNENRFCVVVEHAVLEDLQKYAADFETIRGSFKLK